MSQDEATTAPAAAALPIGSVERETGISKDLLRMWERRYGFPAPLRDPAGDRVYPPDQVVRLRLIRRLMELGFRPGKVVTHSPEALQRLIAAHPRRERRPAPGPGRALVEVLTRADPLAVRDYLRHELVVRGLRAFVEDVLPACGVELAEARARGDLSGLGEHLYTDQAQALLRETLAMLCYHRRPPRVVLAGVSGEALGLGLPVAEAVLRIEAADVLALGPNTPSAELLRAAAQWQANVLALSFSAAFPYGAAHEVVQSLRRQLPASVALWIDVGGIQRVRRTQPGVELFDRPLDLAGAVQDWRRRNGPG